MSDDPVLQAIQKFMDAVETRLTAGKEEIRSMLADLETRAAPKVVEVPPGKDGVGVAEVSKRNGEMIVRLTDNTERNLGRIEPKDGEPGKDGIPTREEMEAVAKAIFADFNVRTFADIHQGVYKPGTVYTRGQIVTWGGSLWLALQEAKGRPGEGPEWKLVVKK